MEILAPYYGFLTGMVARLALSLAPSRDSLLIKAELTDEGACVLMREVAAAMAPVCAKLQRFYTERGMDFDDKV